MAKHTLKIFLFSVFPELQLLGGALQHNFKSKALTKTMVWTPPCSWQMNNHPQDNCVPDHCILTHTGVQADWKTSLGNPRVSPWLYSVLVQSSFQQLLKNKTQVFRIWFCLVPKFKSWSHQDSPQSPQEAEKFCFICALSLNLGLGTPVSNSKDTLLSFRFYTQQETKRWKLISALSCPFCFLQWEIGVKTPCPSLYFVR